MVDVRLFQEMLIEGPSGSRMCPADSIQDIPEDRAAYIVGMKDGTYAIDPPRFTSPPTLDKYTAVMGDVLICYPGMYESTKTVKFQWRNASGIISEETTNTYAIRSGNVGSWVLCQVTLVNQIGQVENITNQCLVS